MVRWRYVLVGTRKFCRAVIWAAVGGVPSLRRAVKSINSAPKLKTDELKIFPTSITGLSFIRSRNLHSRLRLRSKRKRLGPVPAFRGRLPLRAPIGWSENSEIKASGTGVPGSL